VATPVRTPHRWRFAVVNGVLIVAAGAAIALAVIVARQPTSTTAAARWSWSPPSNTVDPLQAIAQHVAREYRGPGGTQPLFAIDRGGLQDGDKPIALAELTDAATHSVDVYGGRTALFRLTASCGKRCSTEPAQQVAAAALTRRQGLELALYTLRNVKEVSNVVVVLPPPPTKSQAAQAMVFERGQVAPRLRRPLQLPGSSSHVTERDATAIARTTAPFVYKLDRGRIATQSGKAQDALIVSAQQ
jgi:hypothetical protein